MVCSCYITNTDLYNPDVNAVLSFMHGIYRNGCLSSGPCEARSAFYSIATIKGCTKLSAPWTFIKHIVINLPKRVRQGIIRLALPKS